MVRSSITSHVRWQGRMHTYQPGHRLHACSIRAPEYGAEALSQELFHDHSVHVDKLARRVEELSIV
jgi:hypothetical protein